MHYNHKIVVVVLCFCFGITFRDFTLSLHSQIYNNYRPIDEEEDIAAEDPELIEDGELVLDIESEEEDDESEQSDSNYD